MAYLTAAHSNSGRYAVITAVVNSNFQSFGRSQGGDQLDLQPYTVHRNLGTRDPTALSAPRALYAAGPACEAPSGDMRSNSAARAQLTHVMSAPGDQLRQVIGPGAPSACRRQLILCPRSAAARRRLPLLSTPNHALGSHAAGCGLDGRAREGGCGGERPAIWLLLWRALTGAAP